MPEFEVIATVSPRGLARKFRALPAAIDQEVDEFLKSKAYAIRDEAKRYEAPRVNGYHRSGEMSRQTVAYREKSGKGWVAEMRAKWSIYVRGSMQRSQAWMHKGRWNNWKAIVRGHLDKSTRELNQIIKKAMTKVGL
jgi:hypothetical protein